MFHPWRVLSFAALAAMVSFNLRAATEVATAEELAAAIAANPAGDYKLTEDIDCTGWTTCDFAGTLDGDGHTISGLTVPLFGAVTGSAQFKNLVVDGANIANEVSNEAAGILAVTMEGEDFLVSDVTFSGCTFRKKNGGNAGMVAGSMTKSGLVKNVTIGADCELIADWNSTAVGSIIGSATANGAGMIITFSGCVARCKLSFKNYTMRAGGLVYSVKANGAGNVSATAKYAHILFEDCVSSVGISGSYTNPAVGPFVYSAVGGDTSHIGEITFRRCTNYGVIGINGKDRESIGGIVSSAEKAALTFEDCVNYGNLSATKSQASIGGIVGKLGTFTNVPVTFVGCANLGDVSGDYAGGLIGQMTHNTNYKSNVWMIRSCLQRGRVATTGDGLVNAEAIGYLGSGVAYPSVCIVGSVFQSEQLYGGAAAGASITEEDVSGNIYMTNPEGLVDGAGLAALNAFGDGCNLWKQGTVSPILKVMPDETAPDAITVTFKDAVAFDSAVLKTCVISRGRGPNAPENPSHEGSTFLGWEPADFSALQADTDIVAIYQQGTIEHTVRFFDWDGTQIGEDQVVGHNEAAVAPADPVREGYLYLGWDKDFSQVAEDLDVTATYVLLVQTVDSGTGLAAVLTNATVPQVTYTLTADVELPSDWPGADFCANLDGNGHTIHYAGTKPVFARLSGSASNFVLDGLVDESPKSITGIGARFGLVAAECSGGRIANVIVRNYKIQVSGSASNISIGLICGGAGDGSVIEGCTVEENCELQTRASYAGGIVGVSLMADSWTGADPTLLSVLSCTNHANVVTFAAGGASLAGILADAGSMSSTRKPDIVVSNCVNFGRITTRWSEGIDGQFAGIVANRNDYSVSAGVVAGTLTIADCTNYGDIDAQGAGLNDSGSIINRYGGILGYVYRFGGVFILRCQNRGKVGDLVGPAGIEITGGASGGIAAYLNDTYSAHPIFMSDCANYGAVYGGLSAGGLIGRQGANADYGNIRICSTNCANYGAVELAVEGGFKGQWIGSMATSSKKSGDLYYEVVNCFFPSNNIVGNAAETTIPYSVEGTKTAADAGYSSSGARRMLNKWAEVNGYEPWKLGKVGDAAYPELGIFCEKPYVDGFMLYVR